MAKTFIITGATQGIGLTTSLRLAEQGFQIIGIARKPSKQKFPGELFFADLADTENTSNLLADINAKYDIDGIVNNVGIAIPGDIKTITLTNFTDMMNLNLFSAIQTTQAFMGRMIEKRWGRIVNIASRALLGLENHSVYAASKAGLVAFTRSSALELARTGITVNAIAPGPIETDAYRKHRPIGSKAAQDGLKRIPMQRIGKPNEVAAAIEFFLSEEASFITGQTLFVDGGASIGAN